LIDKFLILRRAFKEKFGKIDETIRATYFHFYIHGVFTILSFQSPIVSIDISNAFLYVTENNLSQTVLSFGLSIPQSQLKAKKTQPRKNNTIVVISKKYCKVNGKT